VAERFKLVIAEAALELVPRELWGHPSVYKAARKRGKRPGETLLDSTLHHQAMKKLPESMRRGRPDIVHIELLEALESPLNKKGFLETYVHTYNDYVLYINPGTRIPRNYNRFIGLMEQLLTLGQVPPPPAKPLMRAEPMNLEKLLARLGPCKTVAISDSGEQASFREIAIRVSETPCTVILVKGFPHEDFDAKTLSLVNKVYAPKMKGLEPWIHLSHLLAHLADILGIA